MKRILAYLMLTALLAVCGCAPVRPSESTDDIQVALAMGSMDHPVHRIVRYGFLRGTEDAKVAGQVVGLNEGSTPELKEKFTTAITQNGVDGMLLWAADDTFYQFMRDMVRDYGTVFVVPHFAHEYVDTKDFIAANLHDWRKERGEQVADRVAELLHEKGITQGAIACTLTGAGGLDHAAADGFYRRMAQIAPQFRQINYIFEGLEVSEATNKIKTLILENPDVVAAYGTSVYSAQSWTNAMQETGRTDLVVAASEYIEDNLERLTDGSISLLSCTPFYEEAYDSVGVVLDILNGKSYNTDKEKWNIVYDAVVLDRQSDLTVYRDRITGINEMFAVE